MQALSLALPDSTRNFMGLIIIITPIICSSKAHKDTVHNLKRIIKATEESKQQQNNKISDTDDSVDSVKVEETRLVGSRQTMTNSLTKL